MRKARNRSEKKTEAEKTEEPTVGAANTEGAENEEVLPGATEEVCPEPVEPFAEAAEPVIEEEVAEIPASVAMTAEPRAREAEPKKKKRFKIIIAEQDNWDKNNRVFVTDPSDGTPFSIERGHEVIVPEGVVNNLRESVLDHTTYDERGNEKTRHIPRYAMTVIGEVH